MQVGADTEHRKFVALFKRISGIAGGIAAILSLAVLIGWYFDVELLKHPFGTSVAFGVAFAYFLLGSVVALDAFVPETKALRIGNLSVVSIVTLFAAAKCIEGVSGADWDALSINMAPGSDRMVPLLYPGVMTPDTSIVQALLGLSYLIKDLWKTAKIQAWQWINVLVVVVCLIPVFGFILGDTNLCSLWGCVRMPVAFAITSIALAFAILSERPDRGFFSALIEPDLLGTALRNSLFAAMIMLPVFAEAKALFVRLGVFDEGLAKSGLGISCMFIFLGTILSQFIFAYKHEQGMRKTTEQRLQDLSIQVSSQAQRDTFDIFGKAWRRSKCLKCSKEFEPKVKICPYCEAPTEVIDALIGQLLEDRYLITEYLGRGGMSIVYKVQHQLLNRQLAIKFLQMQLATNTNSVLRFQREGQAMARLMHPNLCAVHECNVINGIPYLVLEFLQGVSLDELIREEKRISARRTVEILHQVSEGLAHAHESKIVHRDIKPSNVMMIPTESGTEIAKVVDFGLARIMDDNPDQRLSQTGEAFGSPLYMSPEQCVGDEVDGRTDIYGLGCVLYECLSGSVPFRGNTIMDTFNLHISGTVKPFSKGLEIPTELAELTYSMLEKKPENRPATMSDVRDSLLFILQELNVRA